MGQYLAYQAVVWRQAWRNWVQRWDRVDAIASVIAGSGGFVATWYFRGVLAVKEDLATWFYGALGAVATWGVVWVGWGLVRAPFQVWRAERLRASEAETKLAGVASKQLADDVILAHVRDMNALIDAFRRGDPEEICGKYGDMASLYRAAEALLNELRDDCLQRGVTPYGFAEFDVWLRDCLRTDGSTVEQVLGRVRQLSDPQSSGSVLWSTPGTCIRNMAGLVRRGIDRSNA